MRKSARIGKLEEKKKDEEAKKEEERAKLKAKMAQAKKEKEGQRQKGLTKAQKAPTAPKNRKRPVPMQGSSSGTSRKLQKSSKKPKQAPTPSTQTGPDVGVEDEEVDPMTAAEMIQLHRQFGSLIVETLEKLSREEILEAIVAGGYVKNEEVEGEAPAAHVHIQEGAEIGLAMLMQGVKQEPEEEEEAGRMRDGESGLAVALVEGAEDATAAVSNVPEIETGAPEGDHNAPEDVLETPGGVSMSGGPTSTRTATMANSEVVPEDEPLSVDPVPSDPSSGALDVSRAGELAILRKSVEEGGKSQCLISAVEDCEDGIEEIPEVEDGGDESVGEVPEEAEREEKDDVIGELLEEMVKTVHEVHGQCGGDEKPATILKHVRMSGPVGRDGWSIDHFLIFNFPVKRDEWPSMRVLCEILKFWGIEATDHCIKMNGKAKGMNLKTAQFSLEFQARGPLLLELFRFLEGEDVAKRMHLGNLKVHGQNREKYAVLSANMDKFRAMEAVILQEVAKMVLEKDVKVCSCASYFEIHRENEIPTRHTIQDLVKGSSRPYFDRATQNFNRIGRNILKSIVHHVTKSSD